MPHYWKSHVAAHFEVMVFTIFGNKSRRYGGVSPFTILFIKVKKQNLVAHVSMRAALSCICSNRLVSLIEQPAQTSDPNSSKGRI